jgi:SAM-dependent methyltransferase
MTRGDDLFQLYDRAYFSEQARTARRSAEIIVPILAEMIRPRSVVDVGCGTGQWLAVCLRHGVEHVRGIDGVHVYAAHPLAFPEGSFHPQDLRDPLAPAKLGTFDLAFCLEVAEHLPPERGPALIRELTALADRVCFSAAQPGQGGRGHVNERPPAYWEELFRASGFSQAWDASGLDGAAPWYERNAVLWLRDGVPLKVPDRPQEPDAPAGPPTDVAVVCYINGDGDILRAWFEHYRALGVAEFVFWEHEAAPGENDALRALLPDYPARIVGRHDGEFAAAYQFRGTMDILEQMRGRWVIVADSDEFVELPYRTVGATIRALEQRGARCLSAPFLQRLRTDGRMLGHDPAVPLNEEYPLCVPTLGTQLGVTWREEKHPLFFNGPGAVLADAGHHFPPRGMQAAKGLRGVTHHYRWRAEGLEKLRRASRWTYQWRRRLAAQLLAYLDAHDGVLPMAGAFRYARAELIQRRLLRDGRAASDARLALRSARVS